jgi:hypothetical protein
MIKRPSSTDRGASAILVALCLLLLLGMAALAVDLGGAFDDRRQQQSAVDAGSLAAVQYGNINDPPVNGACNFGSLKQKAACRGVYEAIDVVSGGLNGRFAAAADWTACIDPGDDAAGYTLSAIDAGGNPYLDCISFTPNLKKGRVWLPTTQVPTTFGRVLGTNSIAISSFSEAGSDINSSSDVIPFALGPTGGALDYGCLRDTSTSIPGTLCDGPDAGNFGYLDILFYGNETLPTVETCSGSNNERLASNIALGADHELTIWDGSVADQRLDVTFCGIFTAMPNGANTQTGNVSTKKAAEGGLFGNASYNFEGRLMCKDGDPNERGRIEKQSTVANCVDIFNGGGPDPGEPLIDNTPLWTYLNYTSGACSGVSTRQQMLACLADWQAGPKTTPLFTADIISAPRFAAVPDLNLDPSNGTSVDYYYTGFRPVYLDSAYFKCSATKCNMVHTPGHSDTGACPNFSDPAWATVTSCGATDVSDLAAMTAFILDLDMLDPSLAEFWPSRPGVLIYNLIK